MPGLKTLTPLEAWSKIQAYKSNVYDNLSALFSGDHDDLAATGRMRSFWKRGSNKCRVHLPLAADIASTSANLLFSQEPTYTIMHDDKEEVDGPQQKRLEYLLMKNGVASKLNESAETCAAMGDIYMKLRWNKSIAYPLLDIVQPDLAWPEYLLGELRCCHFFTEVASDREKDVYIRTYECYKKGEIQMALYSGNSRELGRKLPESQLKALGYESVIKCPVDELLAVHIANVRPNRKYRSSMLGRSDFDSLRDSFDSLDETFSSWMRDIRLAKAKLIVPAEYLRKRKVPEGMEEQLTAKGSFEFDADVETYVAMDINTDVAGGTGITPSQFAIRASEHMATCQEIVTYILEMAGYSPQSFGYQVKGSAASGTALNVRERKSAVTKNKKLTYWQAPLEQILTAMVRLDHALYPDKGSDGVDTVSVAFADSMGADAYTVAETLELLKRASAASTITMVRMMHPDWGESQVTNEVALIQQEKKDEIMLNKLASDKSTEDSNDDKSTAKKPVSKTAKKVLEGEKK